MYYLYRITVKGKTEFRYYKKKKDFNDFDLCDVPDFHEGQSGTFLRKDAMFMGTVERDFSKPLYEEINHKSTFTHIEGTTQVKVTGPKILGKVELPKTNSTRPVKKKIELPVLRHPKITKERCMYCGVTLVLFGEGPDAKTLDHVYPMSKGGVNSKDNRVDCCLSCNQLKSDLLIEDFLRLVKENTVLRDKTEMDLKVMACNIKDFIKSHSLHQESEGRYSYKEKFKELAV